MSIDIERRAHAAVIAAAERTGTPHRLTARHVMVLMEALDRCVDVHRWNEAEVRQVVFALSGWVDDKFQPITSEMRQVVALHESMNDAREQALQDKRLIDGDTPFAKEEHARALEMDAASSLAYARVLRYEARQMRREREVAVQRLTMVDR